MQLKYHLHKYLLPNGERRVRVDPEGLPSHTALRVSKVLKRDDAVITLAEAQLKTGRTHQIRVHMASLGHPLVGDRLYGGARHDLIDRQALHAFHLSFTQPMTGKALRFESPLPADMQSLLTAWGLKNPLG